MNSDRIKEIQETTAYPESVSVMLALKQVWNECEQERVKNCSIPHVGERLSLYKWNKSWDDVIAGYSNKNNLTMFQESLLDDLVKYLDREYDDVF